MNNYYEQAVACVKDYVLPMQREMYEKCGRNFDISFIRRSDGSRALRMYPSKYIVYFDRP